MIKPKMRIKTLDKNLGVVGDRLVDQTLEMTTGPKEKYEGPICIEVTISDQNDLVLISQYLQKLKGTTPLAVKPLKAKKVEVDQEPIKEMVIDINATCKTQDDVINYLRERNFKFVTAEFIKAREFGTNIKPEHLKDYQFMVRLIKETKDPKTDKYDPQLVVGINFVKQGKHVRIYTYNEFTQTMTLPWAKKSTINFKKVAHIRFPHYMVQEERDKYSLELRKMKLNPELKPTKFMFRWKDAVDKENNF